MSDESDQHRRLAEAWANDEYVRLRMQPCPGEQHYLVLSDLKDYVARFATREPLRVLDYGAGPSPYRPLFPNCDYRRADYVATPGLAYVVDDNSCVAERDGFFDLVLSTQVAEHVANPAGYFREAFRLLRPGGRFVVTTHGVWPDHGTPFDFQRWTAAGLVRDLRHAGFVQVEAAKLTAGLRGSLFILLDALAEIRGGRTRLRRLAARALQRGQRATLGWVHRRIDASWPHLRIADLGDNACSGPPFYILVAAHARRPAA